VAVDQSAGAETAAFLSRRRVAIVRAATAKLSEGGGRYASSVATVPRRLQALYDGLVGALERGDATQLVAQARILAGERFRAGYDLSEVQTAFNELERAIWADAVAQLPSERCAAVLGYVSALLGGAKDAVAREYVALAARTHTPAVDVDALARGLERP
jgi:hypothetical protein